MVTPPSTAIDMPGANSTSSYVPPDGVATPPPAVPGSSTSLSIPTDMPVVNGTSTSIPAGLVPSLSKDPGSLPSSMSIPGAVSSVSAPPVAPSESLAAGQSSMASPSADVDAPTGMKPVTSIRPTATAPGSENWLPTTMVAEPSSLSYSPPTDPDTATTALPTNIPKIILPNDPDKPAPEGSVPIQIGFLYPLNYLFVANNTDAAGQIFKYLPIALASAGGFSEAKVQVSKLVPYDTRRQWGYITTIAKLDYPATEVDRLQMDLWSANSAIYNNPDSIVQNLTALINPKIDIHGNLNGVGVGAGGALPSSSGGGSGGSGNGGNGGNNGNNNAFGNGKMDQNGPQMATTAGIAMGAVGLSVMYGAAMFIVARRYKRKRQGHRRSSSVANSQGSSDVQYTGTGSPALMGGAILSRDGSNYGGAGGRDSHGSGRTGNSARTANISAPVAAENSLGWN
ncbi:hypothetical protein RJ55_01587 [Drechmeria coniospora]|nr:hypothetical protein RJ55_01587 [Drechmeria coniospora]